jgi:hypothetical protein
METVLEALERTSRHAPLPFGAFTMYSAAAVFFGVACGRSRNCVSSAVSTSFEEMSA